MFNQLLDKYWTHFLVAVMVFTVIWGYWDGRRRRRQSRERYAKSLEEYRKKLIHPNWQSFGESVPLALVELYKNEALITAEDLVPAQVPEELEGLCVISEFHPVNETSRWELKGRLNFNLAGNMAGDLFLIPLQDCNAETGPVYFYTHEDSTMHKLSTDIREFVKGLKTFKED